MVSPSENTTVYPLTKPPPKNMTDIETCSRSCAVHAAPHAAKCSRKTFVDPYKKMTKDSTNSADGTVLDGLTFHAQPYSAKQPIQRPKVNSPYQKKIPPLMK